MIKWIYEGPSSSAKNARSFCINDATERFERSHIRQISEYAETKQEN